LLAQASADAQAVEAGHHDVEDDRVGGRSGGGFQPRFPVARGDDVESALLEVVAQQLNDVLLIVDDENRGLRHFQQSTRSTRA
jgi:hypothetical protein